jgi:alpha-methylacyl-CoA racemase
MAMSTNPAESSHMTQVPPLEGITVVELAAVAPSRFCTLLLGDLGARVIALHAPGKATFHPNLDRGKQSLLLDLKQDAAQELLVRLAKKADVLVDGLAPGAAAKLGADYASLAQVNPALVHCAMSAFGQDGPYRDRPAHDLNIVGLAGMLGVSFDHDGRPLLQSRLISDFGGAALFAALGILAALRARDMGGKGAGRGQQVDIAYLDSAFALLANTPQLRARLAGETLPERAAGLAAGDYAYYALYPTADARWVSVACLEEAPWQRLCALLGRPDLETLAHRAADHLRSAPAEQHAAREALAAIFRSRTAEDWDARFAAARVSAARVSSLAEAFADPQLRARGMLIEDAQGATRVASPIRLSQLARSARAAPAPRAGEHSAAILRELGYRDDEIAALAARNVIT